MNKIQMTIYVTANEIDVKDNKIVPKTGSFYFNGKKYGIKNGDIILCSNDSQCAEQ